MMITDERMVTADGVKKRRKTLRLAAPGLKAALSSLDKTAPKGTSAAELKAKVRETVERAAETPEEIDQRLRKDRLARDAEINQQAQITMDDGGVVDARTLDVELYGACTDSELRKLWWQAVLTQHSAGGRYKRLRRNERKCGEAVRMRDAMLHSVRRRRLIEMELASRGVPEFIERRTSSAQWRVSFHQRSEE
jgi:hypothetical protein